MKKRLTLSALVLFIAVTLSAQQTFFTILNSYYSMPSCVHETWNGRYFFNSHGDEYFLMNSLGAVGWSQKLVDPVLHFDGQYSVPTFDHGFVVSGPVSDMMSNQNYGYVAKTDSTGHVQWMRRSPNANGFTTYSFSSIQQTADSGFIVTGGYSETYVTATQRGGLILKLDKAGNTTWSRVVVPDTNQFNQTQLISVKIAPNGDYIAAGVSDNSVLLCRLDPNGNLLWVKTYFNNLLKGYTVYLDLTPSGECILCTNLDADNDNDEQVCLLKTDGAGAIQWCNVYGNDGQMGVKCVLATDDGGFAFIGVETSAPFFGAAIGKTDGSGNLQWVTKYDSIFVWQTTKWSKYKFEQTHDHGYIFGGLYYDPSYVGHPCVVKTDPLGEIPCRGTSMTLVVAPYTTTAGSNGFAIPGETLQPMSNTEQPSAISDSLICHGFFDGHPKGVEEWFAEQHVQLYPNPANDFLQIATDLSGTLEIYNATGRLVKTEAIRAGTQQVDTRTLSSGLYFAVIDTGKLRITRKFLRE